MSLSSASQPPASQPPASQSSRSESDLRQKLQKLSDSLNCVIRGKQHVVRQVVVGLLARGNLLLEDVPGVGKTTLAKALATLVHLDYRRVQCTPDLMPADIFGFSVFNPKDGTFHFRRGPIFTNLLLVDEINRASPRTQSALLEAMAERQVTIEGDTFSLPEPFLVLATQNPLGFHGTTPLPESQLDRFLLQLSLDYPDPDDEVQILYDHAGIQDDVTNLQPVLSRNDLLECQRLASLVRVERNVADYIVAVIGQTRHDARVHLGCSPRASVMLFQTAQAQAFLSGRDYVLPDDVQQFAPYVIQHRIVPARNVGNGGHERLAIAEEIVKQVDVPV